MICLEITLLILKKAGNLLKFEITVNNHGEPYDFENSQEIVDDFLKSVRSHFKTVWSETYQMFICDLKYSAVCV